MDLARLPLSEHVLKRCEFKMSGKEDISLAFEIISNLVKGGELR